MKQTLVPPQGHTQCNNGEASYNNFTRIIRDHLLKKETIDKDSSPKSYRYMIKNQLEKDGFAILTKIIINGSPQFGGDDRDLTEFIRELKIEDGEEVVEFYINPQQMLQEITLQNDQSSHEKRLIKKFLEQLQRIPEYKMTFGNIAKDMKRFFKKPARITQSIPHTIEDIYEKLDAADVKTTISIEDLPKPNVDVGQGGKNELRSQNRDRKCPNHIHKKSEMDKSNWDENRDKSCEVYVYSNSEIHRLLKKIYNGNSKE